LKTIYLLRHFKVKDPISTKLNSEQFNKWVDRYDEFDLEYHHIELPKNIEKIYCSSLNRTVKTAKIFNKVFITTPELIEVEAFAFFNTKLKFSKTFWLLIGRILWYFNLSKKENKKDTKQRAKELIEKLQEENANKILLISHGLFLNVLTKELQKKGFQGEVDLRPKNGKIYKLSLEA